jgi:hypothetical protein
MPQVSCKICSKEFYVKPNHLKLGWGKCCSRECSSKTRLKGEYIKCETCGKDVWKVPKDIKRSKSGKFFCNKSCQTKWRNVKYSGENHPLWRGGEIIYRERMLKNKRTPKCKNCGIDDLRVLIVHHKDQNRKNSEINNLVWLCRNCHHLVHIHKTRIK